RLTDDFALCTRTRNASSSPGSPQKPRSVAKRRSRPKVGPLGRGGGHTNPDFLGIPVWLPLLWGFAMVTLRRVVFTLEHKFRTKVRKLLK
ncbi:MAG TPA: hypothetical protein VJH37_04910, partial [Candidatus Nanoarchaeia archaeon]|nr:hypothetical protein [Candidatus Nanoarchaeia archaeon]